MNEKALGLACLATLVAPSAMALERDLAVARDDNAPALTELTGGVQLLNKQWSECQIISNDAVANPYVNLRWYDIGLHLDGVIALGADRERAVDSLETTEITGRLDYLFEVENVVQVLPFVKVTAYPHRTGKTPFNWLGTDVWFMLPVEGVELGMSGQYNMTDQTDSSEEHGNHNHWVFEVGAREFWQDAPLDLMFWQVAQLANRSYHRDRIGDDHQGMTTFNLGGKATLPLPWEGLWTFVRTEAIWFVRGDDRNAVKATSPTRDGAEFLIGIGLEYRMD